MAARPPADSPPVFLGNVVYLNTPVPAPEQRVVFEAKTNHHGVLLMEMIKDATLSYAKPANKIDCKRKEKVIGDPIPDRPDWKWAWKAGATSSASEQHVTLEIDSGSNVQTKMMSNSAPSSSGRHVTSQIDNKLDWCPDVWWRTN